MSMIILLSRNTLELTKPCLRSLLAQSAGVPVMVVDNASTDGTAKYLIAEQYRNRKIFRIHYAGVQSVARCWNDALRWAWAHGSWEALVVNSDTELLPETYSRLLSYLEDCSLRSDRRTGMITAVGVDKNPTYPTQIAERPHPDYSCYMITSWAHRQVPFDERYDGAYFEDADHHVRLTRAGIWAGSINLGFLHHSSGTLKQATPEERRRIEKHYDLNKRRFYAEYGCVPGTKGYEALFGAFQ